MKGEALLFFLYLICALGAQALFALFEMAAVSVSRIRLQYNQAMGDRRAKALHTLLHRPSLLFGTTLIGVNAALQVGSECARRLYEALGLSPDWSILSEVFLVVIFAELSPLFAARRFPEQVAMALAPPMHFLSLILRPLLGAFNALSHWVHRLMGTKEAAPLFLSKEEVWMAFAEHGEEELHETVGRAFALEEALVSEWMEPIGDGIFPLSSIDQVRTAFKHRSFLPVIQNKRVLGVLFPRDLLTVSPNRPVQERLRAPWCIAKENSVLEVLESFRQNNQTVAVVLDQKAEAIGILTLDAILNRIFGFFPQEKKDLFVERTFSADLAVATFNREFGTSLVHAEDETMGSWLSKKFGAPPSRGERWEEEGFEFTIEETSLLGVRSFSVKN